MAHKFIFLFFLLCNANVSLAGAWGTGSFENDSALDWVGENISVTTSLNVVARALDVVQRNTYSDVDDCSSAIAASEIVASLNTNNFDSLPKNVANWARSNKSGFNKALVSEALKSVNICADGNKSELAQLWVGPQFKEWKKVIDKIVAGLK